MHQAMSLFLDKLLTQCETEEKLLVYSNKVNIFTTPFTIFVNKFFPASFVSSTFFEADIVEKKHDR